MSVKIFDIETAKKIGNAICPLVPLFEIPEEFFGNEFNVIRRSPKDVEVEDNFGRSDVLSLIFGKKTGYSIPFCFIEAVKEW